MDEEVPLRDNKTPLSPHIEEAAMVMMHRSVDITAGVFAAYLKCPTKAYLIAHGEDPPDTFVAVTRGCMSAAYKARAGQSFRAGLTA